MATMSLGFEPNTTISKWEIAQRQLHQAINLFLAGDYVCAITLAGAAEGIFAGLLNQQDRPSVVEKSFETIQRIREQTNLPAMGDKKNTEIYSLWNIARNKLKHHGKNESEVFSVNLFDEAYWMLRRSIANADALGISIRNRDNFENWVIANINM